MHYPILQENRQFSYPCLHLLMLPLLLLDILFLLLLYGHSHQRDQKNPALWVGLISKQILLQKLCCPSFLLRNQKGLQNQNHFSLLFLQNQDFQREIHNRGVHHLHPIIPWHLLLQVCLGSFDWSLPDRYKSTHLPFLHALNLCQLPNKRQRWEFLIPLLLLIYARLFRLYWRLGVYLSLFGNFKKRLTVLNRF